MQRRFKIPARSENQFLAAEVQRLSAEVESLRAEYANLVKLVSQRPQPARKNWERYSAPTMPALNEEPSPLLQLLFSSQVQA